jgi:hypothetical protein
VFAIISSNVSNVMGPVPEAEKGPKNEPPKKERKK